MQKMDLVAPEFPASIGESGPYLGAVLGRVQAFLRRLSDRTLALVIGAVLFVVAAWPLGLVDVPPLQDLPNHLATVTVITHPERYPEFVGNGFFKTNAALFGWLCLVGKLTGVKVAARLFVLMVLGLNAVVFPQFILRFTDRRRLIVASFFIWPVIHNWFVSMGMLDFALGVPLSLLLLMAADRQRLAPGWLNATLVAVIALADWYAHVFTLMVACMLLVIHVAERRSWRDRFSEALRLFVPLGPAAVLTLVSLYNHMTEPVGAMTGYVDTRMLIPPWELAYNLWAEWFWGFTWLSISSLVPAALLALYAYLRRNESPTFFSPFAFLVLGGLFLFLPYVATNWFHVNSRVIPYLWVAAFLRLPSRIDPRLYKVLGVSALLYTVGMGIDYHRLDNDRLKFTAGMSVVPEGSRLLPLIFRRKLTSENTRSLQHAWGFYVTEKQTSAPLLFAHSRSFPVMYRDPPDPRFNHLVLESFAPTMLSPDWGCNILRSGGIFEQDCEGMWRRQWASFWQAAAPQYDHVLMWDATPEVQALVPPEYRMVLKQEHLTIYERSDARVSRLAPVTSEVAR
ncbi:hypothetical protein [Pendulispora albinea]|uniref:Mannosyltransferase n=1 Tax=Pendulispora albinea TaxID=2741071 RepID=A0ABZ2M2U3_9BACT